MEDLLMVEDPAHKLSASLPKGFLKDLKKTLKTFSVWGFCFVLKILEENIGVSSPILSLHFYVVLTHRFAVNRACTYEP